METAATSETHLAEAMLTKKKAFKDNDLMVHVAMSSKGGGETCKHPVLHILSYIFLSYLYYYLTASMYKSLLK